MIRAGLIGVVRNEEASLGNLAKPTTPKTGTAAPTRSGAWRPDAPFNTQDGLKVSLRHERGVTPKGYLTVPFRFQAPPLDRWGRRWEFDFPTYDTVSAGERPQVGGKRLQRPSFQTMFLDEDLRWMVWNGSLDVQRMLTELKAILDRAAPFRLVVSQPALWGARPLLSMVAVFTAIAPEQRGGEVGTEYADVEFLEWPRQHLVREGSKRRRPSDRDTERRYRLVKGSTLYKAAREGYHQASAWKFIARENGIRKVRPDDADGLARWARQHNRSTLRLPPAPLVGTVVKTVASLGNLGS